MSSILRIEDTYGFDTLTVCHVLIHPIALDIDAVLLDNMGPEELRRAVVLVDGRAITEASGGITLATAPALAATGVDLLSLGWLTQSARALDIGLDYVS